jgi:hypothetical protein
MATWAQETFRGTSAPVDLAGPSDVQVAHALGTPCLQDSGDHIAVSLSILGKDMALFQRVRQSHDLPE